MRWTLVGVALCVSMSAAQADNKAWTTAKKTLPAGQQMVVVANFSAIRDSGLFQTVWPMFLAQHKDAATMLGKTKETCGFDAMAAIDSVVLTMQSPDGPSDNAMFVVALKGVTQKDVDTCITKLEQAETGKKVTITTAAGITSYDTGAETLYMRWTDKSTLVFTAAGKDILIKNSRGGLGSDRAIGAAVSGIKADAALSVIYGAAIPLDQVATGAKASLLYASATLSGGNIGATIHLVLDSAKTATDLATKVNTQLAEAKKSGGIPPALDTLVKSLAVKSGGSELVITATAPEKDVLGLAGMALGGTP